ncbi:NACHT and ankyrin domain protein [Trichoderma pleuroticola]
METIRFDDTPGCYMNAVHELLKQKISLDEFFIRCLAHYGPKEERTHHPPDDCRLQNAVLCLLWEGEEFGLMAAAMKACEDDPLASSYNSEILMPFFNACAAGHANVDALLSSTAGLTKDQFDDILLSPLFRQAMLFIAITTDNTPLALDILDLGPLTIPSEDVWILKHESRGRSSDEKLKKIPNVVWASILRHGWAEPTFGLVLEAVVSDDSAGSVAMLSAIWEVNPELMKPDGRVDFTETAIKGGTPEILQHLWDLYGIPESDRHIDNEMIVQAVRNRKSGGIRMLEYLLGKGLDINYRTVTDSDEEVPWQGDPIFHSERLYAFHLAPISRRLTALHAAAFRGNAVAVKYLLERGATVDSQDGLGQTARYIANRDGHKAVVEVIDAHEHSLS